MENNSKVEFVYSPLFYAFYRERVVNEKGKEKLLNWFEMARNALKKCSRIESSYRGLSGILKYKDINKITKKKCYSIKKD